MLSVRKSRAICHSVIGFENDGPTVVTISVCKTTNAFGVWLVGFGDDDGLAHGVFILILDDKFVFCVLLLACLHCCLHFRLHDISESALPTHQDSEFVGNLSIFGHFAPAAANNCDNFAV